MNTFPPGYINCANLVVKETIKFNTAFGVINFKMPILLSNCMDAKNLPGTSTNAYIQKGANILLNGPLNVDLYGVNILSGIILQLKHIMHYYLNFAGVDEYGKPVLVKILGQCPS